MKSLQFSADSWHYRFIRKYASDFDSDPADICAYIRAILKSCLIVLFILIGVTFLSFLGTQVLVGVVFSLINWMWIFTPVAEATMFFVSVITAGIGVIVSFEYIKKKRREARQNTAEADGFVINAYKSWKEKYCARVEIVRPVVEEGPAEY